MATLEDRILGEKTHYYCSSSSESEPENSDDESEETVPSEPNPTTSNTADKYDRTGNTGPKGVIKDWQRYKQLETEKNTEKEQERLALIQKLSLTCRSALDEENDPELSELLNDDFLEEYRKKRMEEMLLASSSLPNFGSLIHIHSAEQFLEAVDKENKSVKVVVHIYEDKIVGCRIMNSCLEELSKSYPNVKFCRIQASVVGVSNLFKVNGVPALLIYKNGSLVGNFIKLTEELGDEFTADDVEHFLIEVGMLNDKTCVPKVIKNQNDEDSD